jgi:hypothetical protein
MAETVTTIEKMPGSGRPGPGEYEPMVPTRQPRDKAASPCAPPVRTRLPPPQWPLVRMTFPLAPARAPLQAARRFFSTSTERREIRHIVSTTSSSSTTTRTPRFRPFAATRSPGRSSNRIGCDERPVAVGKESSVNRWAVSKSVPGRRWPQAAYIVANVDSDSLCRAPEPGAPCRRLRLP